MTPLRTIQHEKLAMAARHDQEMQELKRRHKREMQALEQRELTELALAVSSSQGGAHPCSVCDKEVVKGNFFVCAECAAPVCNAHRQGMSECTVCSECYCHDCVEKIDKCQKCAISCKLVCCALSKMPCGDQECADCRDQHWTRCSCMAEGDAMPEEAVETEEEGMEEAEEDAGEAGYCVGLVNEQDEEEENEDEDAEEEEARRHPRLPTGPRPFKIDKDIAFRWVFSTAAVRCVGGHVQPLNVNFGSLTESL